MRTPEQLITRKLSDMVKEKFGGEDVTERIQSQKLILKTVSLSAPDLRSKAEVEFLVHLYL